VAPLDREHDNDAVQQQDEAEDGNSESTTSNAPTDILSAIMKVISLLICNQHSQSVAISVTKDYTECSVQSAVPPELVQGNLCNNGSRGWK
jgi:hypothetical protein